ncbi:MFS general substrate transporter [Rhizoclosmatium globosum]|uniref:MFS general substrate transporter n=1 Tax=Rhizoclosmatium globosum TaxID=329046 RepID=A0A1Y2CHI9_9FUNG|nr:MFS general substrate transporter [Rhizoclosmatium globosum]|eukprot:ORY46513.1 MFS general substrate transporter [Rhizoclosmatium globosum]
MAVDAQSSAAPDGEFIRTDLEAGSSSKDELVVVDSNPQDSSTSVDSKFTTVRVPLTRLQFVSVVISLSLGVLLAALDQTIVASALKSIVSDLGRQDLLSWIGSGYMLTSCAFCPLYGKFADIFGRKWTFIAALGIFELGSLVCAIATSMPMLIIGRAVAGLGGGGVMSLVFIILSDIVSIQDRGKYQGLIGGTYTFASVLGPLIGGSFVDHATWRWCFYINLPIGAITIAVVVALLKFPPTEGSMSEKLKRIDYVGATLLICAIISLLVPIQLGGTEWAWSSAATIVCFILAVMFAGAFVYVEGRVAEPIIPYSLFKTQTVPALLVVTFCLGASMFTAIYYTSLFFQIAQGYSATGAGIQSVPLILGAVLVSIASGFFVSRTGKYKMFFFLGPIFMIAGIVLMSYLDQNSSMVQKIMYLVIFGMGTGSQTQMSVLALQSSVEYTEMAIVTAVGRTFQQLGGSVGVAIIGNILNTVLQSKISAETQSAIDMIAAKVPQIDSSQPLQVIQFLQDSNSYPSMLAELVSDFVASYKLAYLSILPFPVLILVAAFFVKQYAVKGKSATGKTSK